MYHNPSAISWLTRDFTVPVDVRRLLNVTYNPRTGEVKCYSFAADLRALFKYDADGVRKQYVPYAYPGMGASYETQLSDLLGYRPDFDQVVLDTVEGKTVYLSVANTPLPEYLRLFTRLLELSGVDAATLYTFIQTRYGVVAEDLGTLHRLGCVTMIRVALEGGALKFYSPFFIAGNGAALDDESRTFLEYLTGSSPLTSGQMESLYIAYEPESGRYLIVTQDARLKAQLVEEASRPSF